MLSSKNKINIEFSMTSMTDIVFLLLIFFMITSDSFSVLDIALPKSMGKQINNKAIVVEIDSIGRFALDGILISRDSLENRLIQKFKLIKNHPSFIIKADKKSKNSELVHVISIAYKNRYKVVIATQPMN